jgi:hypothetical protein
MEDHSGVPARGRSLRATVLMLACSLLGACTTTPLLQFERGDSGAAGASMPSALGYLSKFRSAYQGAVSDQINREHQLTNGLVGAGALVAALAVGKAHRDAITGAAFLAGTAYTVGNVNNPRTRVLIYQAGVEALNCAERAVGPYAISSDEAIKISGALDAVQRLRPAVQSALDKGAPVRAGSPGPQAEPAAAVYDEVKRLADELLISSDQTLKAGREFVAASQRGARELVSAVNVIDAAVSRSVITSTPELSSLPNLVSGLAGAIGSFAPGAGIDQRITDGLKAAGGAVTGTTEPTPMEKAAAELKAAVQKLATAQSEANSLLAGRTGAFPADAFKDCGVAQVVTPLAVSPTSLTFVAGREAKRSLLIDGGVKPYFVEIDGPVLAGVSIKAPIRFDNRIEVAVAADKAKEAGETTLRIIDSAPSARSLAVVLTLTASTDKPDTQDQAQKKDTANTGGAAQSTATDLEALKKVESAQVGSTKIERRALPALEGDTIVLKAQCPAGTAGLTKDQIGKAFLAKAGLKEPPVRKVRVEVEPASCVKS